MVNYILDTIMIPAGNSLAIIIIIALMYLLFQSFKQRESMSLQMKVSALLVFVGIIVYDIAVIINKSFIPRDQCVVRQIVALIPFLSARATMYYFFIIRMQVSFRGSAVAFKATFIKTLKVIVIVVYTIYAICICLFSYKQVYVEERNICLALDFNDRDAAFYIFMSVNVIFVITDLMLGIVLCVAYLKRLWTLYKEMKAMMALSDYNGNASNANNGLKLLVIKQAKLAYIAYISSIVFVFFGPPLGLGEFSFVDSIINALSVFCAFNYALNSKMYQVLCNCNGAKWPQYVCCCFCCGCCCYSSGFEEKEKVEDETVTKNTSEIGHSGSSDDGDEKTVETDIAV